MFHIPFIHSIQFYCITKITYTYPSDKKLLLYIVHLNGFELIKATKNVHVQIINIQNGNQKYNLILDFQFIIAFEPSWKRLSNGLP